MLKKHVKNIENCKKTLKNVEKSTENANDTLFKVIVCIRILNY